MKAVYSGKNINTPKNNSDDEKLFAERWDCAHKNNEISAIASPNKGEKERVYRKSTEIEAQQFKKLMVVTWQSVDDLISSENI